MAARPYPFERGFTPQHHIDALREELASVRRMVLQHLPHEWRRLVLPPHDVSREDSKSWAMRVGGVIADKVEYGEHGRAVCPLCGSGTNARIYGTCQYVYGYTPVGMERHLSPWGAGIDCHVIRVVQDIVRVDHKAKWPGCDYGPYTFD